MDAVPPSTSATDIARSLAAIVGKAHVLNAADLVAGFSIDWTGRFRGHTPAVVRPGNVSELADVVAWCCDNGVAVVPQGGNTGLVGGGVPLEGEVVVSLRRLDALEPVDVTAAQVTVGAGATLEMVQHHAGAAGLEVGVDLAARSTATIGGMVATNAGGTRVVRYGPMRSQVAGVEAVLGDGSVVSHLAGLAKDNTGYDLAGLLCGSEGTLGVISRVRLRLVPHLAERSTILLGLDDVDAALDCLVAARSGVDGLEAAEIFFHDGLDLVGRHFGLPPPFLQAHRVYLLLEAAGRTDPTDELLSSLRPMDGLVRATAVATDSRRRHDLWRHREAHSEAINSLGPPNKLDVTVPLGKLTQFCATVPITVAGVAPDTRTFLFGHLGDGNIHVNVVGDVGVSDAVDEAVLGIVAGLGGSISAEHGIGTAKARYLHLNRSAAEIAAFRRVKSALDPRGILNPHALLPPQDQS